MKFFYYTLILLILSFSIFNPQNAIGQEEDYIYKLTQSTASYEFWTTLPSERVFKDDAVPTDTDSEVKVYAAKNEFEPFQIVVKPASSGNVTINMGDFGSGITTEIYQVKYVNITQVSDALGKLGDYPDPLWPLADGASINVVAGENTSFWINIYVPSNTSFGDYMANITIGGVSIPIRLHVFNFSIPNELHIKSQMNYSHEAIQTKYGVSCCGAEYWEYVDKIKQYFIDHRLTPKSVTWPSGLTSSGGDLSGDYQYNCDGGVFTNQEPNPKFRFENNAERYVDGTGLLDGQFTENFNGGTGFPSFMVATYQNNDASADQRPSSFCSQIIGASDWYTGDNPTSAYNQEWFEYIGALYNHLQGLGYQDKAYFYFANEPQDQDDYNAVAWYSRYLKDAAPSLKLMVSEEPKPEIYSHADYVGDGQIDIWLPVLDNYDPTISHDRETNHGEESWIYFLHGTRPPYFNPITLDHPGIESKFTGWFLWKYRIKGIAYYSLNNWDVNPWTNPLNDNHNGDLFMLYPPTETNSAISYGANNHRFVPSIRYELMRDSFEDYEYFYVMNSGQPQVDVSNSADTQVDKVITGLTSYTRDSEFMYNLRRLVGLYVGGEAASIPDIQPPAIHPRAQGASDNYYINFQDPYEAFASNPFGNPVMRDEVIDGQSYRILDYDGKSYYAIGAAAYDENKGFGWFGNIINQPVEGRDPWGDETNEVKRTYVGDNYGKVNTFDFALPNGIYDVTLCVGRPRSDDAHNKATIEGIVFVNDEPTNDAAQFIIRTNQVSVWDNSLTVEIGLSSMDAYTMLDYLLVEAINPLPVELSSFHAEVVTEGIKLHWKTAAEINNAGFNLYKNGELITFIQGAGTTNESHEYSFTDTNVQNGTLYSYKLSDINSETGMETFHPEIAVIAGQGMIDPDKSLPTKYALRQNHPNPFNPETIIEFEIPDRTRHTVELRIYDASGKLIKTLVDQEMEPGYHSIIWDGKDDRGKAVNSGVYFYKMETEGYSQTRRCVMLK